jgi:hypothetical protein
VTRFGDFSPIGRVFILGNFFKITKVAKFFVATLFHGKSCAFVNFDLKMGRANFAQTHLVTLPAIQTLYDVWV